MEGEFINGVYYADGEDGLSEDFNEVIESTLSINDNLTIKIFIDGLGVGEFNETDEKYNPELVNIILRDPGSDDAAKASDKIVRSLASWVASEPKKVYCRG